MERSEDIRQRAIDYIRGELAKGNTLAKKLLGAFEFENGTVSTLLWTDMGRRLILDNFDGGYAPEEAGGDWELAEVIVDYLATDHDRLVVFEDCCREPTWPSAPWEREGLSAAGVLYVHGDELYHLMDGMILDLEPVANSVTRACFYPGIGTLTYATGLRHFPNLGHVLTDNHLDELVCYTVCIMVAAYDREGFLIWQREQSPK